LAQKSINFFEISILKVIYDGYTSLVYYLVYSRLIYSDRICYDYLKIQDLNCKTAKRILRQFKPKTFLVIRFSSIFLFAIILDSYAFDDKIIIILFTCVGCMLQLSKDSLISTNSDVRLQFQVFVTIININEIG